MQSKNIKHESINYNLIDLIRFVMALVIVTSHTWTYFRAHFNINLIGGFFCTEAFFIISGFFLSRTATKDNPPKWHSHIFKRIWKITPSLILAMLFALLFFGISCGTLQTIDFRILKHTVGITWFLTFLLLSECLLFPLIKKIHQHNLLCLFGGLFLGIASYLTLFLLDGSIELFKSWSKPSLTPLLIFVRGFCRSTGGISLGIFIFFTTKFIKSNFSKLIQWFLTIIFISLFVGAIIIMMFYSNSTPFDFLVVACFFISIWIVFSRQDIISQKQLIPNNVSSWCRGIALNIYLSQWVVIDFVSSFEFKFVWLQDKMWWWILYGFISYICCILMGWLIKVLSQNILKFVDTKC